MSVNEDEFHRSEVVDAGAFSRLRRWGGEKLLQQLIGLFVTQVPERIAAARRGVESGSREEVERAAHTMRSSCAQVGALRMEAAWREVEHCVTEGDLPSTAAILDRIEVEFRRYVDLLPFIVLENEP